MINKCEICGKEAECFVICSAFGAYSQAVCEECLIAGKENYRSMVNYIANAGRFPEEINPQYQEFVRIQLKLHNITEEQFIHDVDIAINEEQMFWDHINECSYDPSREF